MMTTFDRRKFLTVSGVTAATAVTAGVGGCALTKHTPANTSAGKLSAPAATPTPTPTATTLPAAAYKPPPLATSLNIPGISPFYTPNADFYRVDTALVTPQLQASSWQLKIHGMVDHPMTITFDQLMKMPMIEQDITLTCVSEAVGGGYVGNARWQGTLLADVLRKAGIQSGADQIVMRDAKGMTIGVATEPVMDGRKSLLAVGMNGQPLPAAHGYPVRVVVPGLYGYVSATKWVVDMEFTTFGAFNAYWVKQGWSQQAVIKTESRIDVPKARSSVAAGQVTIAGVAWAQHRGIEAVEVSVDGVWYEAKLAPQDTIGTWRQWYYVWNATTPGLHVLQVRATDKTGYTQTAVVQKPEPNGATGYHTIRVTVT
jgi:DMSO/TMAO reductase YedYZ molybdopterin-dependent catalytic subunit